LFPGLAVAGCLAARDVSVTLLVSPKEVDQLAVKSAAHVKIVTLPAVGLSRGRMGAFLSGFWQSYRISTRLFRQQLPDAALAMGGFTSAAPLLAAKRFGAPVFLHESNTIPGRANRWASWVTDQAFVGFPEAAARLRTRRIIVTGTPVRSVFRPLDRGTCRAALGLDPLRPVALVMGGSQGANGINELVITSLPLLKEMGHKWQWIHLTGAADLEKVRQAYAALGLNARVEAFVAEMELMMGAATAAISRAGASSLAEIAAMRLPAVLIPFPSATDNHQFHNARAFEQTGAAKLLEQSTAKPADLARELGGLMLNDPIRQAMQAALVRWQRPDAARQIAETILDVAGVPWHLVSSAATPAGDGGAADARSSNPSQPESSTCCLAPEIGSRAARVKGLSQFPIELLVSERSEA
jgi:UDP-N-acetylglucosamine--N-acetylmuramyl-(pentapeptide) pyrophosphoryl-undecaprenol N-acetylglucosamine transferase